MGLFSDFSRWLMAFITLRTVVLEKNTSISHWFHDFENNFSKNKMVLLYFVYFLLVYFFLFSLSYLIFFSFLSTFYLVSLMRGRIPHYRRSRKAQSNIFCWAKYGSTASTAFSRKFKLNFCLCSFFL